MKALSTADWNSSTFIIFGQPGVGKTWLAASACQVEEMKDVILLAFSEGSASIRSNDLGFDDVITLQMETFQDAVDFFKWVAGTSKNKKVNDILSTALKNKDSIGTIILDDISVLADMCLTEVVEKNPQVSRFYEGVPTQQDYGAAWITIRKLFRQITTFSKTEDVNIIATSWAHLDKGDMDRVDKIRPMMPGQLAQQIPGLFNLVGYYVLEVPKKKKFGKDKEDTNEEIKRVIHFGMHDPKIENKDHADRLGSIESPTMQIIMDKLKGNR